MAISVPLLGRFTTAADVPVFGASTDRQFHVTLNRTHRTLHLDLDPVGIPCFNRELLAEIRQTQDALVASAGLVTIGAERHRVERIVVRSRSPGVFSLGGELPRFLRLIRIGDRSGMRDYARLCVEIVHRNHVAYGLPISTVALVEGQCFGGGFEAALSSSLVVAERSARLGFPEVQFGLFPGMGAYHFVERRAGRRIAERLMLSGETLTAAAAAELGLVDLVCDDGAGSAAIESLAEQRWRVASRVRQIAERDRPITLATLLEAADAWVDVAMALPERELAAMERIARIQARRFLAWPARGELVARASA